MTLHFLNGRQYPKQHLSTESVNKQILGTGSISTLIQALTIHTFVCIFGGLYYTHVYVIFCWGGGLLYVCLFVFWEGYIIHIHDFLLGGGVTIHIFMLFL